MIQNYFVVAWRNFLKRKFLSSVNIIGLSFGIAFALLAFLFIHDEFSFDTSYPNKDLIYRVDAQPYQSEVPQTTERSVVMPQAFAPTVRQELAGVDYISRHVRAKKYITAEQKETMEMVNYVDEDFLKMFSLEFIRGDASSALNALNTMIISDEIALKLYGTTDAVGKPILTRQASFTVSGVFKAQPENSTLVYEILTRFENAYGYSAEEKPSWYSSASNTFIQRNPALTPEVLQERLHKMSITYLPPDTFPTYIKRTEFELVPLTAMHFDVQSRWPKVSNKTSSYVLGSIAVIVLIVACLNYVLLSLANSASRTREIGVRKVIGATRKMIRMQFLSESIVIIFISVPISLLMLYFILPEFNSFMGKEITLLNSGTVWIGALAMIVFLTGILAGGYPAAALSHLLPQKILKGSLSGSYKTRFSGTLIIVQFAACLVMLICAVVMFNQMTMVEGRDLGFNKEQVVVIKTENERGIPGEKILSNFRSELISEPNIRMISALTLDFGQFAGVSSKTGSDGIKKFEYIGAVDYDFFELLDIKLIEGRFFSRDFADTTGTRLVVNEAYAKQMPSDTVLGKIPNRPDAEIIGVVENFNFESLEHDVKPMAFELGGYDQQILVKIGPQDIPGSIARLEQCWKKVVGDSKFNFTFFDDYINNQYKRYTQWIRLVTISAALAIGIACLGLLGIISLAIINRTKEISLRKVLGASTVAILTLFSKYYLRLIIVAFLLAGPAAYYLSTLWLQDFAYKIEIGWLHYVYPLAGIIGLALLIVGSQVLKTVRINPAETLKSE